jgi:predicted transglutaminase-like protease
VGIRSCESECSVRESIKLSLATIFCTNIFYISILALLHFKKNLNCFSQKFVLVAMLVLFLVDEKVHFPKIYQCQYNDLIIITILVATQLFLSQLIDITVSHEKISAGLPKKELPSL